MLIDRVLETTGHLPEIIVDAPELWPHLQRVWEMFQVASSSRATTFGGIWHIPLRELLAVLDLFGIEGVEDRHYYVKLLQHLDGVYVKFWWDKHGPKEK